MQNTFMFNDDERELILQLLAKERRELRPEIHHTDNRTVRDGLKDRLHLVDHLLERMQSIPVR